MQNNTSKNLYTDGDYAAMHPDWHLEDAPGKAIDIFPSLSHVLESNSRKDILKIADVGAGVGGVLTEVGKLVSASYPHLKVDLTGFEISPHAVNKGRELFPLLDLRHKYFEAKDGSFDIVMLIDVLEHLENPRDILRAAIVCSEYLVVRQPLVESFSSYLQNRYRSEREVYGHINHFNYRSFIDLLTSVGWEPVKVDLVPWWELATPQQYKASFVRKLTCKFNRVIMSYLLGDYNLIGVFKRADSNALTGCN